MSEALLTPYQLIDLDKLELNMARIRKLKSHTGCKVLLTVKGFSNDKILPYFSELDGINACSLYEARLGREMMNKEVHTYSTAFNPQEFEAIAKYSDTIIFNSISQLEGYYDTSKKYQCDCGIRMKVQGARQKNQELNYSRFGVEKENLLLNILFGGKRIDGIHIHAANNDNADRLSQLLSFLESTLGPILNEIKWINLGGGHLFASNDYNLDLAISYIAEFKSKYNLQLIFEPCSGIVTGIGSLHTTVLDIIDSKIVILDASPICHMTLSLTVPYKYDIEKAVYGASEGYTYVLVGATGYPGDIWGTYTFERPLKTGSEVVFMDTAQYSMVTNNSFNGIPFPTVAVYSQKNGLQILKKHSYSDYFRSI